MMPSQQFETDSARPGWVYLVGAGPGDPGLITVRGVELLATADLVIYDNLANPALLAHAPQAELFYVGKKAAEHTLTQDQINQLLIDRAQLGLRIVRLKGGDPFVFGRGGEECEALHQAGIPFEVVPGITAAIAAPAYAGIPVTHRDLNSSFTLITGHEKEQEYQSSEARDRSPAAGSSDVDWSVIAKLPCIAFYMGVKSLPRICQKLIAHGMDSATPVATIQWGTHARQRVVTGTLATQPSLVAESRIGPPAITLVGKVVQLRPIMNWFEARPLFGHRVLVTRSRQQSSQLARQLSAAGAQVIQAPTIELHPSNNPALIDHTFAGMSRFNWIIFTSPSGVDFTRAKLDALGLDARAFGTARIAAIGQSTAKAITEKLCLKVDLCPERAMAETLADALIATGSVAGNRILLLRAEIGRPVLVDRLNTASPAEIVDLPLYCTAPAAALPPGVLESLRAGEIDWITFTSSSTARGLVDLIPAEDRHLLQNCRRLSIGPVTTATLVELGLPPTAQAASTDMDAMMNAMIENTTKQST